ncbi:MAG: ATP-binding cassette domain-containing protein [Gemmatimonadales bacterium]|nr:ATP-binding cassette domain-containing protein [Gemmatimonadales bacterium]
MSDAPALELTGITKRFGSVLALDGADFSLAPGEVHALLGENGAGKSTLMHVAFGMIAADAGTIRVRGAAAQIWSPRDARALGIGMVHQHFTSIGTLTVRENLRLDAGPRGTSAAGLGDSLSRQLLAGFDQDARAGTLPVAERQRLEIVKALSTGALILLLDEPTALLAPSEVEALIGLMREFTRAGGAVVLITHKLDEVLAAADRVTVLRRGVVTLTGSMAGLTETSLAEAMIGGPVGGEERVVPPSHPASSDDVAVRLGALAVRPGELVGVAAVEGNGQREILRAIAGLSTSVPAVPVSVTGRVAFVPEDRTTEGLIPELSLTENVVLGLPGDPRWTKGARLDWPAARARTGELLQSFGIRAGGPDALAATLSGGNQQKVVLARALEGAPRVLVAENPTRGLDIRATALVHERLRAAAAEGVAVIVYSTDLDEVLTLAPRILVVYQGRIREAPPGRDRRTVGAMMLGLEVEGQAS